MTNVKEAVQAAIGFVGELFPDAKAIRLEEVEPSQSKWSVVLSFIADEPTTLAYVVGGERRIFKAIEVDSESGEPRSLKVWKN